MARTVAVHIPAHDEERDVADLTAALIGVSGIEPITADTAATSSPAPPSPRSSTRPPSIT